MFKYSFRFDVRKDIILDQLFLGLDEIELQPLIATTTKTTARRRRTTTTGSEMRLGIL